MADGYLNKCKSCTRSDVAANRSQNIEAIRAYDRSRSTLPHRVALRKAIVDKWIKTHPKRRSAQVALNNAVRDGRVTVMLCFCCGKKAEAHHPDYDRPLDVVWLCAAHHKQAHAATREAVGA